MLLVFILDTTIPTFLKGHVLFWTFFEKPYQSKAWQYWKGFARFHTDPLEKTRIWLGSSSFSSLQPLFSSISLRLNLTLLEKLGQRLPLQYLEHTGYYSWGIQGPAVWNWGAKEPVGTWGSGAVGPVGALKEEQSLLGSPLPYTETELVLCSKELPFLHFAFTACAVSIVFSVGDMRWSRRWGRPRRRVQSEW